ncbi:MAG: large-conductance mechanosensitive channel protein MscL [Firmicutes bacterium]|nr:large-conductance mechanosensitive channel protein MscL [Bacillota bacterium]MBR6503825.1 large-conductance mechanosensitive channel protein MscL [Bacillota bacterium]
MKSFINEFKEFAMKGSVMDMAIGVIIGGAFGKIVTSLVDDLIMPILGIFTGGVNFADLKYVMTEDNAIAYGAFIQNIIDFLLIALSIFIVIKLINKARRPKEEEEAAPEEPAEDVKLLSEIRDLLKEK